MAFLIDDLFLLPFKGICQGVKEAAEQDLKNEEQECLASLTQLHLQLESDEISQGEFDERETALLLRLEKIQQILHPEPPLTKRERLQKHFPEEFEPEPEPEPENEPTVQSEVESIRREVQSMRQNDPGELVTETEIKTRRGFASIPENSGAIRPGGIEPVSMERAASDLEPTKWKSVGLGSGKPGSKSKTGAATRPKES